MSGAAWRPGAQRPAWGAGQGSSTSDKVLSPGAQRPACHSRTPPSASGGGCRTSGKVFAPRRADASRRLENFRQNTKPRRGAPGPPRARCLRYAALAVTPQAQHQAPARRSRCHLWLSTKPRHAVACLGQGGGQARCASRASTYLRGSRPLGPARGPRPAAAGALAVRHSAGRREPRPLLPRAPLAAGVRPRLPRDRGHLAAGGALVFGGVPRAHAGARRRRAPGAGIHRPAPALQPQAVPVAGAGLA